MKRGKTRLIAAAAVLVLATTSIQPAFAAGERTRFVDVPAQSWYAPKLMALEAGGDLSFRYRNKLAPESPATTEQFCELLLEIMNVWCRPPQRGESWEVPVLEKVTELTGMQVNPGTITRDLAAEMIVRSLQLPVGQPSVWENYYMEDVSDAALAVTEAGIMSGCVIEGKTVFSGHSPLTNAQMMAVGANVKEYLTSTGASSNEASFECPYYEGIIDGGTYLREDTPLITQPKTKEDWCRVFDYMALHELTTITLTYPVPYTEEWKTQVRETLSNVLSTYFYERPEYFHYGSKIRMLYKDTEAGHELTVSMLPRDEKLSLEQELQMRREAWAKAIAVRNELYASGSLSTEMTEKQRAEVLINWVDKNTIYKDDGTMTGHSAWSVFTRGYGVCDAYSSAYQMLLDLEGIQNWGIMGKAKSNNGTTGLHHWTAMILDGVLCYSDATWNDSSKGGYFGVSEQALRKTHSWT